MIDGGGFEVTVDVERRYLRLRAYGLWSVETAIAYQQAMYEGFRTLGPGAWRTLSDRRQSVSQSPEVQTIIMETMRRATDDGCTHTAFVLDSALTTLQIRRLGAEQGLLNVRVFDDEEKAMRWLLDDVEPARR
jgi:hypothetical protein